MDETLSLSEFVIDHEKHTLFGILYKHEPSLLSFKFHSKEFPEVEGYVFEYFEKNKFRVAEIIGYDVPDGTWFGSIHIIKGWEIIISGLLSEFSLVKNTDEPIKFDISNRILRPGEIYLELKKMNKPFEFSSFFIDVRGGSTEGLGRNEHGKPHFHLKNKNSLQDIGKIDIPDLEIWNKTEKKIELLVVQDGSITKSEKKEILDWLSKDNNKNYFRLLEEWIYLNRFNNRVL